MEQRRQIINHRQLAWLIGAVITSRGVISYQQEITRLAKMDTWFVFIGPIVYTIGVCYFFAYLNKTMPGLNLFDAIRKLTGQWIGGIINLLLLAHIWLILARDIHSFSKFINTVLLPLTPNEFLILLVIALLWQYGRTSVEVIARVNDLFFPLYALLIVGLPFLLSNEIDFRFIEPVLASPLSVLGPASMLSFGSYGDFFVIGALIHNFANSKVLSSSLRHGVLIGGLLVTAFSVTTILTFGVYLPIKMVYPSYSLVQQINITDFLDRIDVLILVIWFPTVICKLVVVYIAFLYGFNSIFRARDYTLFNKPMALFILITSCLAFQSTTQLFAFTNFVAPLIIFAYQPMLFLILWVLAAWKAGHLKGNRQPIAQQGAQQQGAMQQGVTQQGAQQQGAQQQGVKQGQQGNGARQQKPKRKSWMMQMAGRLSPQGWHTVGIAFVAGCVILIALGLSISHQMPRLAISCAIGYILFLLLALVATYFEMERNVKRQ